MDYKLGFDKIALKLIPIVDFRCSTYDGSDTDNWFSDIQGVTSAQNRHLPS